MAGFGDDGDDGSRDTERVSSVGGNDADGNEVPWNRRTKEADYSGMKLEEFPKEIAECAALTSLDVSNNWLQSLPESLSRLRMLTKINASHNSFWDKERALRFGDEPTALNVGCMPRLTELDLSCNGMERSPLQLFKLKELRVLDLSRNLLPMVPVDVKHLTSLRQLRVESNSITTLPDDIACMDSLEVLQAYDNQISTFELQMAFPPLMKTIDLHYNRIGSIEPSQFSRCTQLRHLNLANNHIAYLDERLFRWQLHTLSELHLDGNCFQQLPRSIGFLKALTVLTVSKNRHLTDLPKSIGKLSSLVKLDASGCSLSELPRSIGKLTCLQMLIVSDNQLASLPPTLGMLRSLELLDVSNNRLAKLPPSIAPLMRSGVLALLKLVGNNGMMSPPLDICKEGIESVLEHLEKVPQTIQEMEEGWELLEPTAQEEADLFDVTEKDLSWSEELQSSSMYSRFLAAAAARAQPPAAVSGGDETEQPQEQGWLGRMFSWIW